MNRLTRASRLLAPAAALWVVLAAPAMAAEKAGPPTVEEARKFVEDAQRRLPEPSTEGQRASWVQSNFITYDTQLLAAKAGDRLLALGVELAQGAARFDGLPLPPDVARPLDLLKRGLTLPAPADPARTAELSDLATRLEAAYGAGKYCPPGGECKDLEQLSAIVNHSRDPQALLTAWTGWHSIAPPMRKDFTRIVEIANQGARDLGYADTGVLWRSKYDMPADAFAVEIDRLWQQVKPLYDSLHCYVRAKLSEKYGSQLVALDKPIPAHLLGNMWAQDWRNLYDLVAPAATAGAAGGGPPASAAGSPASGQDPGYDLTQVLQARRTTPLDMVRYGERFFTSLGFAPLPQTFWERSLFTQPRDRDVVCHASAWDIDNQDDLRIKMCIKIDEEDFRTIHHELGHNFYQRSYKHQPFLYQDSANDGFHEAVGDTIALSVTPEYLQKIGLIDQVPPPAQDLGILLRLALDKVAFLPFGLLIDQWRWKVFSGAIKPQDYNRSWWQLREKYQGVRPPGSESARSEAYFDPAAKYHVAASVPYMRYFLADILQFQFHRGLCQAAGFKGPLNRCSIYGNQVAGERLRAMLEMGLSRPWPEALKAVTGQEKMDASAITDYFAPLKTWLDKENAGKKCGW
jgi:peptidyl-dipeptidase A